MTRRRTRRNALLGPALRAARGSASGSWGGVPRAPVNLKPGKAAPVRKKRIRSSGSDSENEQLDAIARSLGRGQSFKSLSAQEKEVVRQVAERMENPAGGPPIRSTLKTGLTLYDRGVQTAYDWTAGLPSRLGHALLSNPMSEGISEILFALQFFTAGRGFGTTIQSARARIKKWSEEVASGDSKHAKELVYYTNAVKIYEDMRHSGMTAEHAREKHREIMEREYPRQHNPVCGCPEHNPSYKPMMLLVGIQMSHTSPHPADNYVLHGPWKFIPKYTTVHVLERGRGGHRFLVRADYFGAQFWAWVDKENLGKYDPDDPSLKNPRRAAASGRHLPPGTKVIINDSWSLNAPATIVKWGYTVHPLYKSPETALVRMERSGKEREVALHTISLPEGETGWPKGSTYRPNPGDPLDRFSDLQKQGFMKSRKKKKVTLYRAMTPHGATYTGPDKWEAERHVREYGGKVEKIKEEQNPRRNPQAAADRMYEVFHGKPPDTEILIEEEVHEHEHLATLGRMVSLVVETRSNKEVTLGWKDGDSKAPWLACDETGTQLYIEGGDQSIPLGDIGMGGKEWIKDSMVIGDLVETTYRTEKDFDKFETIDYYHANGEESGEVPQLLYDPRSKKMYISGGKYRIEHDGIID